MPSCKRELFFIIFLSEVIRLEMFKPNFSVWLLALVATFVMLGRLINCRISNLLLLSYVGL